MRSPASAKPLLPISSINQDRRLRPQRSHAVAQIGAIRATRSASNASTCTASLPASGADPAEQRRGGVQAGFQPLTACPPGAVLAQAATITVTGIPECAVRGHLVSRRIADSLANADLGRRRQRQQHPFNPATAPSRLWDGSGGTTFRWQTPSNRVTSSTWPARNRSRPGLLRFEKTHHGRAVRRFPQHLFA